MYSTSKGVNSDNFGNLLNHPSSLLRKRFKLRAIIGNDENNKGVRCSSDMQSPYLKYINKIH
jgi:hypothetical protein